MHAARMALRVFLFFFPSLLAGAQVTTTASARLPRGWLKAASLRPGEPMSVQLRFGPTPTTWCTLVWIDNAALACDAETATGRSERLVFPAAQVYSVARNNARDCDESCGSGKRLLVGAVVGALAGGLVLGQSSGRAGAVGAMLGAGVGGGIALGPPGFSAPMRPAMAVRVPLGRPRHVRLR